MHNELLHIGPVTIYGYGLMIALGIIAALTIAEIRAKKIGLNTDALYYLTFVCAVTGFLGAKGLFVLVEFESFLDNPAMVLSGNGFVVYGGIICGVLGGLAYCKFTGKDFWDYFDIVLPSVAVAQGLGRVGCFLAGCCYGRETDAWYGIAFTNSEFAPNGVKLIPTQLISAAGMLLIAVFLMWYATRNHKKGQVGALYLVLYSMGRFGIEFLRNDYRGEIGPLSTSQFISCFVVVFGLVLWFVRGKKSGEATT